MIYRDGQWHHIAGVYDGSRYKVYVDGDGNVIAEIDEIITAYDGNEDIKI